MGDNSNKNKIQNNTDVKEQNPLARRSTRLPKVVGLKLDDGSCRWWCNHYRCGVIWVTGFVWTSPLALPWIFHCWSADWIRVTKIRVLH